MNSSTALKTVLLIALVLLTAALIGRYLDTLFEGMALIRKL